MRTEKTGRELMENEKKRIEAILAVPFINAPTFAPEYVNLEKLVRALGIQFIDLKAHINAAFLDEPNHPYVVHQYALHGLTTHNIVGMEISRRMSLDFQHVADDSDALILCHEIGHWSRENITLKDDLLELIFSSWVQYEEYVADVMSGALFDLLLGRPYPLSPMPPQIYHNYRFGRSFYNPRRYVFLTPGDEMLEDLVEVSTLDLKRRFGNLQVWAGEGGFDPDTLVEEIKQHNSKKEVASR